MEWANLGALLAALAGSMAFAISDPTGARDAVRTTSDASPATSRATQSGDPTTADAPKATSSPSAGLVDARGGRSSSRSEVRDVVDARGGRSSSSSGDVVDARGGRSSSRSEVRDVVDARGVRFESGRYQRIASASVVADPLLLELAEPNRVIAYTAHSQSNPHTAHRYRGKPTIRTIADIEQVLELRPDLVITNSLANAQHIARLEEAGVPVFDLGPIEGVATLLHNIDQVASLLGHPERGAVLASDLHKKLDAVSAPPTQKSPTAIYLSVYGNRLFGGAARTSYHDVLRVAGLRDAATENGYRGAPQYGPEEVLALDPDFIVTKRRAHGDICRQPGLAKLRACVAKRVIRVEDAWLDDASFGILAAAEEVHAAVAAAP